MKTSNWATSGLVAVAVMLANHLGERAMLGAVRARSFEILTNLRLQLLRLDSRNLLDQRFLGHLRRIDPQRPHLGVEIGVDRQAHGLLGGLEVMRRRSHPCSVHGSRAPARLRLGGGYDSRSKQICRYRSCGCAASVGYSGGSPPCSTIAPLRLAAGGPLCASLVSEPSSCVLAASHSKPSVGITAAALATSSG